jgi:alpha-L-fucosidase
LLCLVCAISARGQLAGDKIAETNKENHPVTAIQDTESPAQRDARMAWWREARFGMFIHWGLYSEAAGRWKGKPDPDPYNGEWIMNTMSIPVADYKTLAPKFNPTKFDAHTIVSLAKAAGMKYIIITAKHHEGFAMFDSKADGFNIVAATPFHRDPLKELADECRKQGIKLGFYYSQDQDWTAPGGGAAPKGDHKPPFYHWDDAQDGDFDAYFENKALPQLKELLTNYGEFPSIIWFDTPSGNMTPYNASEVVALLNQHPKLIWNNRLGGGYPGDTETPEQFVPPQGYPGRDFETCMTINGTWGYKSDDKNFKPTKDLLRFLIDTASKGGNYLLNIGPDGTGTVPPEEVDRLTAMGQWMRVNGEAIYGTKATLFGAEAGAFSATEKDDQGQPKFIESWKWRSTTAPNKIYIEIFDWPATRVFHLDSVPGNVTGAYLLADAAKTPLKVMHAGSAVDVTLPAKALDPVATVLVLETKK